MSVCQTVRPAGHEIDADGAREPKMRALKWGEMARRPETKCKGEKSEPKNFFFKDPARKIFFFFSLAQVFLAGMDGWGRKGGFCMFFQRGGGGDLGGSIYTSENLSILPGQFGNFNDFEVLPHIFGLSFSYQGV